MTDPRLTAYLETARERRHPFYARQALRFAAQAGDAAAMEEAMALGAASYQPEPPIRMRTEEEPEEKPQITIVQLRLFEEAA